MKLVIGLAVIIITILAGCVNEEQRIINERASIVTRFQEAYPDTWKQELLTYDIEQEKIRHQRQDKATESLLKFSRDRRN